MTNHQVTLMVGLWKPRHPCSFEFGGMRARVAIQLTKDIKCLILPDGWGTRITNIIRVILWCTRRHNWPFWLCRKQNQFNFQMNRECTDLETCILFCRTLKNDHLGWAFGTVAKMPLRMPMCALLDGPVVGSLPPMWSRLNFVLLALSPAQPQLLQVFGE